MPESIWVKCDEAHKLSEMEAACLISDVDNELRLVIVEPSHRKLTEKLVRAVKVGTAHSNLSNWLVDFPSGQRLLLSAEKVENGNTA